MMKAKGDHTMRGNLSNPESTINIAMVGATDWVARYHLPTLQYFAQQGRVAVHGIWNRTTSKAETLAHQFDIPKVYATLAELQDDQALDCVSVAVNSSAVTGIVRELAQRKLPLICEKPPGKDSREAKSLAELVTTANIVAFNRRYVPINQRFKAILEQHKTIHFVECHFYRRNRDDPYFVTETGIHGINLLEYFFGAIRRVETRRWSQQDRHAYNWLAVLEFASGVQGLIKFFPFAGVNLERIEAHGSDLSLYLEPALNYTDEPTSRIVINENTRENRLQQEIIAEDETNPLVAGGFIGEYGEFFEAVVTGKPTTSNFQNAWTAVEVAEFISSGQSATFSRHSGQ
jgi:predicted dehydrogenase